MSHPADFGIRYQRIKNLYLWTFAVGTTTGLMVLLFPLAARYMFGFPSVIPPQDPVVFGFIGSIWLCIALIALLGLRAPLQFLPIFLVQLVYKILWFTFVFAPLAIRGEFPLYGTLFATINAVWIVLDLRAIPFRYLFRFLDEPEARLDSVAFSSSELAASE